MKWVLEIPFRGGQTGSQIELSSQLAVIGRFLFYVDLDGHQRCGCDSGYAGGLPERSRPHLGQFFFHLGREPVDLVIIKCLREPDFFHPLQLRNLSLLAIDVPLVFDPGLDLARDLLFNVGKPGIKKTEMLKEEITSSL